ncbi:hypothetical protein BH10PSE12_BH10PSE12_05410 [soil metagenome]
MDMLSPPNDTPVMPVHVTQAFWLEDSARRYRSLARFQQDAHRRDALLTLADECELERQTLGPINVVRLRPRQGMF